MIEHQESPTPEPRCESLPPEVATLLILIGIVGVPLPGPGLPFILAGGVALWPRTFRPIESRFRRNHPRSFASVARIVNRFEVDLNKRYPTETRKRPHSMRLTQSSANVDS